MKSWALPAAIIVAVEFAFALAIGARVGFHYRMPFGIYMVAGLVVAGLGASTIVVTKLAIFALQREPFPARRLFAERAYLLSFVSGIVLASLQISILTWTKIMLPIASPFWADPFLASFDHVLFGTDPWIIAGRLFGWATPFIDRAYVTWAPLKFVTLLVVICMPESPRKSCAMLAYFITISVVAVGQYLLSSAGPIFYAQLGYGHRFDALQVEPWVLKTRAYLWHDYLRAGGDIGGGISAMPSFHVAGALWIALVWRACHRHLGIIGFAYFGLIAIGSVLLGWHYAVDGIAGVLIAVVAWKLARRFSQRKLSFDLDDTDGIGIHPAPSTG